MFGPILTQQEYDCLLDDETKQVLANIVRHPTFEQHSNAYRQQWGHYRNGDLDDPIVRSITGYGYIPPKPCSTLAVTPIESPNAPSNGNGNETPPPVTPPNGDPIEVTDTRSATILTPAERTASLSLKSLPDNPVP